jgi:hypothetical protein
MRIIIGKYRFVVVLFRFAFKFPKVTSSKVFLQGMLSNLSERNYWKHKKNDFNHSPSSVQSKLNPTIFCLPFGLMSVQPKIYPIEENFTPRGMSIILNRSNIDEAIRYIISANSELVENCIDSFGISETDQLVVVDYGGDW